MPKPRLTSVDQLPAPRLAHEEVPFGDFTVLVWALTARDVQKWSKDNATVKGGKVVKLNTETATARLLAAALRDDSGRPMVSLADMNRLIDQSSAVDVARVEKVARRLSGLTEDEDEDQADDDSGDVGDGDVSGNGFTPRMPSSTGFVSPSGAEPAMNS